MLLLMPLLVNSEADGRPRIETRTNAKYGVTFSFPRGWVAQVNSSYQVVARGKEGGLETHAVISATPEKAVRDYFLVPQEIGAIHKRGRWTCASSRTWSLNPRVTVVVCAEQLEKGNALLTSLIADKDWLEEAGGETLLRTLVASMRGFHADDD